jgi:pyruvate/2-oxoglutarate dehydrogenase complex dihydrolipoamide acyltransferase (E2) component
MDLADLIAAVKAAATKDALETLVKDELSLDLDKRKTLKALRAEVLKGLGETVEEGGDDDADAGETASGSPGESSEKVGNAAAQAPEPPAAPTLTPAPTSQPDAAAIQPVAAATPAPAPVTPPALDEAPEPAIEPTVGNRLLRHKVSGRTVLWTPALSKLVDLEEV